MKPSHMLHSLLLFVVASFLAPPASAGEPVDNGTFRFLTQSLPVGTTNVEYIVKLVAVNADGSITYAVDDLAPGLTLDPATGVITGRPTETYNQDITVTADDGVAPVQAVMNLKINASGGGGNGGADFDIASLAQGRVGVAYSESILVQSGTGPYIYCGASLPPGLRLDGATGALSGTPLSPGTYMVELSVSDLGEANNVVTVLPLEVLPAESDFRFTTSSLNNGEVGTPFLDQWTTAGAEGQVTFSASGLPPGLTVDAATGEVSGTPTAPGDFPVRITASDSKDTLSLNLRMIVAPSDTSNFHWEFIALPTGVLGQAYSRQPPLQVLTRNGVTVTYSAEGLPPGVNYNTSTGELTGTPTQVGEYPVVFTAEDTTAGETMSLELMFLVLPVIGGDVNNIITNLWIAKEKFSSGKPGKDSWKAVAFYNDDRRSGNAFDPATDALGLQIGTTRIDLPADSLQGTTAKASYKSPKGETPAVKVGLSAQKQMLAWSTKKDTLSDTTPGEMVHTLELGDRRYQIRAFLDEKGGFKPALGYRRPAFVVVKGSIKNTSPGEARVDLGMLLGDPVFAYEAGVSTLRIRLLDDMETVLFDRDFTDLGTSSMSVDNKTGATVWTLGQEKDLQETDRVEKFKYRSSKGGLSLRLEDLTLAPLAAEAHLTIELTIGDRIYTTAVTFFEGNKPGTYTLKSN